MLNQDISILLLVESLSIVLLVVGTIVNIKGIKEAIKSNYETNIKMAFSHSLVVGAILGGILTISKTASVILNSAQEINTSPLEVLVTYILAIYMLTVAISINTIILWSKIDCPHVRIAKRWYENGKNKKCRECKQEKTG